MESKVIHIASLKVDAHRFPFQSDEATDAFERITDTVNIIGESDERPELKVRDIGAFVLTANTVAVQRKTAQSALYSGPVDGDEIFTIDDAYIAMTVYNAAVSSLACIAAVMADAGFCWNRPYKLTITPRFVEIAPL